MSKKKFYPIDLSRGRTNPLEGRHSKASALDFGAPVGSGASFAGFLNSFPQILKGKEFREFVEGSANQFVIEPRKANGQVVRDILTAEGFSGSDVFLTELWDDAEQGEQGTAGATGSQGSPGATGRASDACGATLLWSLPECQAATVTVGDQPWGVGFDGSNMWVANYGDGTVSKIDVSTNTVTATVTVGDQPYGVGFDGSNIWVTNLGDGTVSKIVP